MARGGRSRVLRSVMSDGAGRQAERLHKLLAAAGVASRRRCETLIESGRVTVDGQRVTALPAWIDAGEQTVRVDGRRVPLARAARAPLHLALNKPRGVVTTTADPQGRRTVLDLLDREATEGRRLFPVGRLDVDSTGLILLTDDGAFANRITHPRYGLEKVYEVHVRGEVDDEALEQIRRGVRLAHPGAGRDPRVRRATPAAVERIGGSRGRSQPGTVLRVTLREGQNREIRRLLARFDFPVKRLKRVAIGPVGLRGLGSGAWRPLTPEEVRGLVRRTRSGRGARKGGKPHGPSGAGSQSSPSGARRRRSAR